MVRGGGDIERPYFSFLALTDLMAWLYREMPNANFIAFGRRLFKFFPIRRSFLSWCGQHFDVQQATSIKRAVRMPTIAEKSACTPG